jgi:hypothetical protein
MIPLVAVVSVPEKRSHTLRLWIPMFLLWLLAVAVGILLLLPALIFCAVCGVNPFRLFVVSWQLLRALKDTNLEFAHRSASVSICIL